MIAVIDYKAGNAPSVRCALDRLGIESKLCATPEQLQGATHIILPGVGSAGATMTSLADSGFIEVLGEMVVKNHLPFLGVCVGMQILFEHSEEEDATCLGWLAGDVKRFTGEDLRIPQMGWNNVSFVKDTPFEAKDDYFYFVNSYHVCPNTDTDVWAVANYGGGFVAAVNRDNIYGTQFHIEKSGEAGLALLKGFCATNAT